MVNIQALIDDAKCFQTVRSMRWPDGVRCTECGSAEVTKDGRTTLSPSSSATAATAAASDSMT